MIYRLMTSYYFMVLPQKPLINWYYTPKKSQPDDLQIRAGEVYGGVDVARPNGPTRVPHVAGDDLMTCLVFTETILVGIHGNPLQKSGALGTKNHSGSSPLSLIFRLKPPWNWNCPIVPWQSLMRHPPNNNKASGRRSEAKPQLLDLARGGSMYLDHGMYEFMIIYARLANQNGIVPKRMENWLLVSTMFRDLGALRMVSGLRHVVVRSQPSLVSQGVDVVTATPGVVGCCRVLLVVSAWFMRFTNWTNGTSNHFSRLRKVYFTDHWPPDSCWVPSGSCGTFHLCSGKKAHLQRWIFSLTTPFFHGFPSTPRTTDGFHRPRGDHHEQRGFPCAGRGERGISPMLNGCPFGTCSPNTYTHVRCFHSNLMSFCWWEVFVVGSFWSI